MDHRCLYGHRVLSSFTFAIQNRTCPTCGAETLTIHGYRAARRLANEGGMDPMAAFAAIRILETEWTLVPTPQTADAQPTGGTALAADEEPAPTVVSAVDEVEVIDPQTPAKGAVKPVVRERSERAPRAASVAPGEDAFFKGA